jgi:transposase
MSFNYGINRLLDLQATNFEVFDMDVKDDKITYTIKHKDLVEYICKHCGHAHDSYHDKDWIHILDLPLGNRKVVWRVERMRILCHCQMNYRAEKLSFKSEKHFLTQRYVDYIEYTLCTKMFTVADVSRLFNLDYGIIYKIDHDVLRRLWQLAEVPDPINIAVDEKSYKKGHKYVTIVSDIDRKMVIWVSEGKEKTSLDEFFKIIGPERCARIQTVSKDLHKPYIASCQEYIPQALEVADPFHVVKKLNEVLDNCRKELVESPESTKSEKKNLKEMNWVIRYKQENMSTRTMSKLNQLEALNKPLYGAYLLKEAFFEFFTFLPSQMKEAGEFLDEWVKDAKTVTIEAFKYLVDYIGRHRQRILNIILTGRSSSFSEAINRKINVLIGMAYGYHCLEYLKLKILQRCGAIGRHWTPEFKRSMVPQVKVEVL